RGIVHRDLKPENIMVDDYAVVLVLDWGLSKNLNETDEAQGLTATQRGILKGTPAYMSPEQASGKNENVDLRTDVFALGIILYEILTGEFPFQGKSRTEVLEQIMQRQPRAPRRLNRYASRVLAAICMKALDKDPDARYATAKEFAEDIRLYRDYLPTSAYKLGPVSHLSNWIARHPALATGLGTALVLVAAFGAAGFHKHATTMIRLEEQRRFEELIENRQEMARQARKNQLRALLETSVADAGAVGDELLQLREEEAAGIEPDRARAIQNEADELRVVRAWHIECAERVVSQIIALAIAEDGGHWEGLDEETMEAVRRALLQEAEKQFQLGELYQAHNYTWRWIMHGEQLGWNDAEMARLLELKGAIEAAMVERYGAGFHPPDWAKYGLDAFPGMLPPKGAPE
ncbi:MAG: serine/threonine protein kinase, partial [Candidatus Hydrogenedentes bacterium]|nr:serine/threonine protein kinase [Candidatus Hydrogenedentota bacterium]